MLSISRSNSSRIIDPPEPSDNHDFSLMREAVLEMANYECAETGFRSLKFQHCHHKDGNHRNNEVSNGVCLNPLSHLCHHLGYVGEHRLGSLAICPDFTQSELNIIQIIAWVTKYQVNIEKDSISPGLLDIARVSNQIVTAIAASSVQVERLFGFQNPTQAAKEFELMTNEQYESRGTIYGDLRLVFNPQHFSKEIMYWATLENFFAEFSSPDRWSDIANNFMEAPNGIK